MKDTTRFVKAFDQRLRYIEDLAYHSERFAYHVLRNGRDCVLKAAYRTPTLIVPIVREAQALRRVNGIPGVTHMMDDYGVGKTYAAFLKEYVEGMDLSKLGAMPADDVFWARLENTVRSVHARGLAPIHLIPQNVVASFDNVKGTIVDLGECRIRGTIPNSDFQKFADFDLYSLDRLASGNPVRAN